MDTGIDLDVYVDIGEYRHMAVSVNCLRGPEARTILKEIEYGLHKEYIMALSKIIYSIYSRMAASIQLTTETIMFLGSCNKVLNRIYRQPTRKALVVEGKVGLGLMLDIGLTNPQDKVTCISRYMMQHLD